MPTTLDTPPIQIDSMLGKYILRELLGEGGMGQVYRAEDTLLHRNVAIKVLKPEFSRSDDFRQRFLREARLAASIEHDCIAPIYDLGEDKGVWYLAMQLLQGETLHAYLKREKIPTLAVAMSIVAQVLRGLAVAHGKGLIHRDIKPSNLWLEPMEGSGKFRCRILDFGLACNDSTEGYQTSAGSGTFGTVFYMPFEQLNQEKVDHRADLYSLGVVLYEMLTGQIPYRSPSPVAQAFEMWEGPPKAPHVVNPKIPRAISELNLKMLLHDRELRMGSAVEALRELEAIITNPDGKPLIQGTLPDFVPFPEHNLELSLKSLTPAPTTDPAAVPAATTEKSEANPADNNLEAWTMHPQAPTVGFVSAMSDEEFAQAMKGVSSPALRLPPEATPATVTASGTPSSPTARVEVTPTSPQSIETASTSIESVPETKTSSPARRSRRRLVLVVGVILFGIVGLGVRGMSKAPPGSPSEKEDHSTRVEQEGEEHPHAVAVHQPAKTVANPPRKSNLPTPPPLDCTGPRGASESEVETARKAWAEYLGVPEKTVVDLGNGVTMKFVLIPPGKFLMGSSKADIAAALKADPALELKRVEKEEPQHPVVLTHPFYVGTCEVTREEFAALAGSVKPARAGDDQPRLPVDRVSWKEASEFCEKLAHLHLPPGFSKAMLPTEAQWEYICRAGTRTPFHFGEQLSGIEANCNGTTPFGTKSKGPFREQTVEGGQFAPNRFGVYDLHGNLAEWCRDEWQEFSYRAGGRTDPVLTGGGRDRVIRGGSWDDLPRYCRAAGRNWTDMDSRTDYIGFRVVLLP